MYNQMGTLLQMINNGTNQQADFNNTVFDLDKKQLAVQFMHPGIQITIYIIVSFLLSGTIVYCIVFFMYD